MKEKSVELMEKKKEAKWLFYVAFVIMAFMLNIIIVNSIFWIFSLSISWINFIVSTLLTLVTSILLMKKDRFSIKKMVVVLGLSIVIILAMIGIAGKINDLSFDGNMYHKIAIGHMRDGWNPLKEESAQYDLIHIEKITSYLWIEHYPQASWSYGAMIYYVTGNIETGKSMLYLTMAALAFLFAYYLHHKKFKIYQILILAGVATLSPVVCAQFFSFYIDGLLFLIVYATILALLVIQQKELTISKISRWLLLGYFVVLGCNIKFTGLFFTALICVIFYGYWLWKSRKQVEFVKNAFKLTGIFVAICVIALLLVGSTSYVKNFVDHGNPAYPIAGEGKVDIITSNQPVFFRQMSYPKKMFYAIFAKSDNFIELDESRQGLKIPFTYDEKEIEALKVTDTRIAGFGIFFGGMFIISAIIIICYLLFSKNKEGKKIIGLLLLFILITTLALQESWWARYTPQLYIPIILAMVIIMDTVNQTKGMKKIAMSILMIGCVVIGVWNLLPFVNARKTDLKYSQDANKQMYQVVHKQQMPLYIIMANKNLTGPLYNLRDNNITYEYNVEEFGLDHLEGTNVLYPTVVFYQSNEK